MRKRIERNSLHRLARDPEHFMEGAIGGLQAQVLAQYQQRISLCVEDRLGVFALVDRLIDTRAKSGHVRERENGAAYYVIATGVRSDPQYERLVLVSEIMPRGGLSRDYVCTPPLQIPQVSEPGDIAGRPADIRDGELECLSRRPVEARDSKVSVKDDDRNIDRVEDLATIERNRFGGRGIGGCRLNVGRAATCGIWFHRYRFAAWDVYNLRERSNTESETVG